MSAHKFHALQPQYIQIHDFTRTQPQHLQIHIHSRNTYRYSYTAATHADTHTPPQHMQIHIHSRNAYRYTYTYTAATHTENEKAEKSQKGEFLEPQSRHGQSGPLSSLGDQQLFLEESLL